MTDSGTAPRPVRTGCYPGTFNPPTVAHLAVAEAALAASWLDRVDLVVSRVALGKEDLDVPSLDERVAVLAAVAATRTWLGVVVSDHQLIVDLAAGYDAVVVGADKWRQVTDPRWYGGDPAERDAALQRLPHVLVAPRSGDRPQGVELLPVSEELADVSATAVRAGRPDATAWLLPEAAASGHWTP